MKSDSSHPLLAVACVASLLAFAPEAFADEPAKKPAEPPKAPSLLDEADKPATRPTSWEAPAPVQKYPYTEHHGYFRFRPDMIYDGHLLVGQSTSGKTITTSGILPPLTYNQQNNMDTTLRDVIGAGLDEKALTSANIRFRYMPTVHIAEGVSIHGSFDVMDNYVLGSSPDFAATNRNPQVPIGAFTTTMRPGVIGVKEAYGRYATPVGTIMFGRMASNWGMGMFMGGGNGSSWEYGRPTNTFGGALLPHQGTGYDSDYGSYYDRFGFATKLWGHYVTAFWDFAGEGVIARDPYRTDGQAYDMDQRDDVSQWGIAILRKPLTPADLDGRKDLLLEQHGASIDYGLLATYRAQKVDLSGQSKTVAAEIDGLAADQYNKIQFISRQAKAFIFDGWLRFEARPDYAHRLVIEAEGVYLTGTIEDTNDQPGTAPLSKDLTMWGAALKAAWQNEGLTFALDAGAASGDDTRCFGVRDCSSLADVNDNPNKSITAFKFNRDYRVDLLLFREVIGAITNAYYVKPSFSMDAYPFTSAQTMGGQVGVIVAAAQKAEGTPGNAGYLGTEADLRLWLGERGKWLSSVSFGYLIPGSAFTLKTDWHGAAAQIEPSNAWRLLGHLALMF